MENLAQGLNISILGIIFTFSALGTLVLVIVLLKWIFQRQAEFPADDYLTQEKQRELAAALAVAVQLAEDETKHNRSLGQLLEVPHGRWWRRQQPD